VVAGIDSFIAALDHERANVREFLKLLEREQAALVAGDHDRLLAFTEQKAARLLELRRFADQRNRFLAAQGFAADKEGVNALLECHADERLRQSWGELIALAARVRDTNEVNGVLVNARLRHNQASLVALQSAARTTGVYGPDGGTRFAAGGGRQLASA